MLIEFGIHEGILHQSLTIVEHAVNLNGCDILAESSKLALLYGADLSLGIKHIDVDTIDTQETVGYGRACIAGGGYEDIN